MRHRCAFGVAVALTGALAGCGGSDGANDDRRAQRPQSTAAEDAPAQATVALSGCLQTGPGTDQYTLRNVRFEGNQPISPHRDTTTAGAHGITEGSWVRLDSGNQDLATHAGQRVHLTGVIIDTGQNTIGTAGTSGVQTPSGDRSQAASSEHYSDKVKAEAGRIARQSMANGTSAEVRVQQVQGTGERCETERERTDR